MKMGWNGSWDTEWELGEKEAVDLWREDGGKQEGV